VVDRELIVRIQGQVGGLHSSSPSALTASIAGLPILREVGDAEGVVRP
jgi:hypothetical protein